MQLGLDGRDRLSDIASLELGELGAVRDDRVGERVQEPRPLGAGRAAPVAFDRRPRGLDRPVDVRLARHRRTRERLARRRLDEVANLARRGLGALARDEEPVLAIGRDGHHAESTVRLASRPARRAASPPP